MTNLCYIRFKI